MTTTDTPTRPSTELTARVVAEQHDLPRTPHLYEKLANDLGMFVLLKAGRVREEYADPRDDPNAALELLHHLAKNPSDGVFGISSNGITYRSGSYRCPFGTHEDDTTLPISGPAFCYAVVRLAAKVFGVAEGGE